MTLNPRWFVVAWCLTMLLVASIALAIPLLIDVTSGLIILFTVYSIF
jgi:hypothetical protein